MIIKRLGLSGVILYLRARTSSNVTMSFFLVGRRFVPVRWETLMCVRHRRLWKRSSGWGHLRGLRWVVQLGRLAVRVLGVVGRFRRWLWMGVHRVGRGLLVTVGRGDGAVGRLVHLWRHGGGVLMSRHVRQTRRHRHLHVYNEKTNNM